MPWVEGKHQLTEAYEWFLAGWAKRLSWQEVAVAFRTTWDHVFCSVERAVTWGRKHQDLSGIEAIGVDEIAWQRGHRYLALVYQIDGHCKRLLWIGEKRTVFEPTMRLKSPCTMRLELYPCRKLPTYFSDEANILVTLTEKPAIHGDRCLR